MFVRSFSLGFLNSLAPERFMGGLDKYKGPGRAVFENYPKESKVFIDQTRGHWPDMTTFISELILQDMNDNWAYVAKSQKAMAVIWRIRRVIDYLGHFPKQVDDDEDDLIKTLSKHKFSQGDIAYIVGRSKATVNAHLS